MADQAPDFWTSYNRQRTKALAHFWAVANEIDCALTVGAHISDGMHQRLREALEQDRKARDMLRDYCDRPFSYREAA